MKETLLLLIANISAMIATVFAGQLAYDGKDGWGWFLFAAIVLSTTLKYEQSQSHKEEEEE